MISEKKSKNGQVIDMASKKRLPEIHQIIVHPATNGATLIIETLEDVYTQEHREVYTTTADLVSALRRYLPVDKLASV